MKTPLFPNAASVVPGGRAERGFILVFSLLMLMGLSAMAMGMLFNSQQGQVAAQNQKHRIRAFYASDGMRALLAQEVLDGNAGDYIDSSKVSKNITGEVWEGLSGGDMASFRAVANSRPPDREEKSSYLGHNWKGLSYYGVRWRGYVIPPISGPYTFYLRADDQGEFYLGEDENPENLPSTPTAYIRHPGYEWPKSGTGVSSPVSLKAGRRYYFELYGSQSLADGFSQVGWHGPGWMTERPIPGKRLAPYGAKSTVWDTALVGRQQVRYILKQAGIMVYTVNTEAVLGGKGDTTYRSPLAQTLSLLGDNPAPADTLWQRVIFYDFSASRSNPEFEKGLCCFAVSRVIPDMVQKKGLSYTRTDADWFGLDSIGKPIRGPNPKWSCGVDRWFRDNRSYDRTYNYAGGPGDCRDAPKSATSNFDNYVFKDSLPFIRRADLGINAYQFKRFTPPTGNYAAFTPLDGRGFGHEGRIDASGTLHNFAFCMEIHTQFEHTSGLVLEFNGDDDVWLYINDSLVMDLGFVHVSTYASVVLDDLPLTFGETYPLDFFYCERQSKGSSIDLITNLPVLQKATKPSSSWKRDYGQLD